MIARTVCQKLEYRWPLTVSFALPTGLEWTHRSDLRPRHPRSCPSSNRQKRARLTP